MTDIYPDNSLSEFNDRLGYKGFLIGTNKEKYKYIPSLINRIFASYKRSQNYIRSDGELGFGCMPYGYFPTIEACKAAIDLYYKKQNDLSHSRI